MTQTRRAWYKKNKKRAARYARCWYLKNQERQKARSRKRHAANKKEANERSREWRKANPERSKFILNRWYRKNMKKATSYGLVRRYGLTLKRFADLRKLQKDCCAICKREFKKTPHVDHDHKTGVVRGLLCRTCNSGIGMLQGSSAILQSAIDYLRGSK